MLTIDKLEVDHWYAPIFERSEFPENPDFYEQYNVGCYFKYLGNGEFADENGEHVDGFFDPELQCNVDVNAPDGFAR